MRPSSGGGLVPADANAELVADLRRALNGDGHLAASVTTSLLKTFENDPNLKHVRHWKRDWTSAVPSPAPLDAQVLVAAGNGFASH